MSFAVVVVVVVVVVTLVKTGKPVVFCLGPALSWHKPKLCSHP